MGNKREEAAHLLLVSNEQIRGYLLKLLEDNKYLPVVVVEPNEMLKTLKEHQSATVFLDCDAVSYYGAGIYSKIKVACHSCKVVLLCDRSHESHRDTARQAMDIGIYACLWAPYEGWEVLAMVRHTPGKKQPGKKTLKKKAANKSPGGGG